MVTLFERLCAYFQSDKYEKRSIRSGIASVPIIWLIAGLMIYYVINMDGRLDLMTHCTLTTKTNAMRILRFYQVLMFADVFIAICDGCLAYVITKKTTIIKSANKKQSSLHYNNYTLSRAYQENENSRLLSMVFPVTSVFAFGHIIYAGLATFMRIVFATNPDDENDLEVYIEKKIKLLASTEGIQVILTTTLLVVIHMYCKMGKRLMSEKVTKINKSETDSPCRTLLETLSAVGSNGMDEKDIYWILQNVNYHWVAIVFFHNVQYHWIAIGFRSSVNIV
ncbi:unnamed protein product [Bursaphelenchus okinawaensis]|uniref:G_PROTEIN_RECEP_F1_2 domain-containing protein n=1 Tax=Bursaphelenchus okinawaensis TaxID=465554 RepID=A0A811LMP3_9BILA|nr:unnamed protein product [Bursaphelenchus okinawaensis]CAG9128172.1 unnamed protein product [Bursaphelenchus okinawaensis]